MNRRWICGLMALVLVLGMVPVVSAAAEENAAMSASPQFIELLKKMEGFSATPYEDYSQYTFGYGTKCPDDMVEYYKENPITEKEAEKLLREELASFEKAVNDFAIKYGLKLKQNQFDALVSFSFNCGAGWTRELTGYFNVAVRSGDMSNDLLYGLMLWSAAGGKYILINRRMWEANMYINGVYDRTGYPNNFRYVYLNGNGGTLRYKIAGFDSDNPAELKCTFKDIPTGVDTNGDPFVYELAGWSTSQTGGKLITVLDDSVAAGSTLYAQWKVPEGVTEAIPGTEPADNVEVTVTGDVVNVRTGPGTNYDTVTTVVSGDKLIITATATAGDMLWGQTELGWLSLEFTNYNDVIADVPAEEQWPKTGTVSGTGVNVRSGPGTSYEVVTRMNTGDRVEIHEEYTETLENKTRLWGKIAEGSWICLDYVVYDNQSAGGNESEGNTQQPATLTAVEILALPDKLQYVQCQDLYDPAGGVLKAVYSDGSIKAMSITREMVSGFSNEKLGTVTLTVSSGGKSATYTVEIIKATVTFLNYDGSVLSSGQYAYGETVTEPAAPVKPADGNVEYKFMGWDQKVTACDGDAVYTAVFRTLHTVTFKNEDGSVLSSARYAYGETVTAPEAPVKAPDENGEYRFVGWDKEVTVCSGDVVYTAVFRQLYTVVFKNDDGTVLSSAQYIQGETVVLPQTPVKPADENGEYRFAGWSPEVTVCAGNAEYTAEYEQVYTVVFKNYDGTVLSSGKYAKGETVTLPENPTRGADENGKYRFTGWSPEVVACDGAAEYTAVFELLENTAPEYPLGDLDKNNVVDEDDAIYLLRYVVFPEKYPIDAEADYNADGTVDEDDAIYLLRHVVFPDKYPLSASST